MNPISLKLENRQYQGTAAISRNNREFGFKPAFKDIETGEVYPSRFANGNQAPVHLLDGLPGHLIEKRDSSGHVSQVKASIVSGFEACGEFFTRSEISQLKNRLPDLA
jgi:hypothetical protein